VAAGGGEKHKMPIIQDKFMAAADFAACGRVNLLIRKSRLP
jgi:hypothetical protein